MKKHYSELEIVSDVLEKIPHRQSRSVAKAICVCNDVEASHSWSFTEPVKNFAKVKKCRDCYGIFLGVFIYCDIYSDLFVIVVATLLCCLFYN